MPQVLEAPYDLATPPTPFVAVGEKARVPGLTQLAAFKPGLHKRLVKDVLRVGRWKVGEDPITGNAEFWTVDLATLERIAEATNLAMSRGTDVKLFWGNNVDEGQHNVNERDAIAPIDQLFVEGDTLWASFYVTPEEATDLTAKPRKVSVRRVPDVTLGDGEHYDEFLAHVAVVDLPVIGEQGPFFDLANRLFQSTRKPRQTNMALDLGRTVAQINALLPEGMELPAGVDEDNFNDTLDVILQTMAQLLGTAAPETEAVGDEAVDQTPQPAEEPVSMATPTSEKSKLAEAVKQALAPITKQMTDLSNQVNALRTDKAKAEKEAFDGRLKQLGKSGLPANRIAHYQALGARLGYDMALLDSAAHERQIDMGRTSRQFASAEAPVVNGTSRLSEEQVAEVLKEKGLKPVKIHPA